MPLPSAPTAWAAPPDFGPQEVPPPGALPPAPPSATPPAAAPQPPSAGLGVPDVTDSASAQAAFDPTGEVAGPQLVHIPCPNGHMLETPVEMVGEEVICPHCGEQFRLREKNSVEYKRKKREEQERRDIRSGKRWLTWAIIVLTVVVVGLIVLVVVGNL
jgi:hypothetical protein